MLPVRYPWFSQVGENSESKVVSLTFFFVMMIMKAKWEQIDGDSCLREGRRLMEQEKRAREQAQVSHTHECG